VTPSTLTYEVAETPQYLDPGVSYFSYDYNVLQNVYEPILWFNGSCSTCVIPWLAQSYTASPDLKTYSFTLRSGIHFADGEPLNSTAVYFSLNRLLVGDGSSPVSHGTEAAWLVQQLLDVSLSSYLSGSPQKYNQQYLTNVLKENFVEITGPLTFKIHTMQPNSAFPYLLGNQWANILAPNYVMTQDLSLWKASSSGYKLPNPNLSGGSMNKINQYFQDELATCDSGLTSHGCGATYLDGSYSGSMGGTGPYLLQSYDRTTNTITLTAKSDYWGGPYQYSGGQKIAPKITTIQLKFVPDQTTREVDLQNAAKSGQAMAIDLESTNLYDVAGRSSWLNSNQLVSGIPGVSMYGPYPFYGVQMEHFVTNVTNVLTGQYYKFQPFADLRIRLAFADSVNMTQLNQSVNNKLGTVATMVNPPGLPPQGSYNSSIRPIYSFNPDKAASLLLDAMQHPLTKFHLENGTLARPGLFNDTFGCAKLNTNNQCSNPVPQTITLTFPTGTTFAENIFNQLAGTINNISTTYNMGLTVSVTPLPSGQVLTEALATHGNLYMYDFGWIDDYPWAIDFLGPMFAPYGAYTAGDGWNLPRMGTLYQQAVNASARGDIAGIVAASNAMNALSNQEVQYLWQVYPVNFVTVTSNVQGFYFNPSLNTAAAAGVGPEYFATLY
jgi:ABC-type transport system substrate-binding protein